jgi:hypothetical protein
MVDISAPLSTNDSKVPFFRPINISTFGSSQPCDAI